MIKSDHNKTFSWNHYEDWLTLWILLLENIFGPRNFKVKIVNFIFKVKTLTLQQLFTSAGMLTRPFFLTYDQQHALPRSEPVGKKWLAFNVFFQVFWTALNKS